MTNHEHDCVAECPPGPPGDLLASYEQVALESRRLMLAVERGDWDAVARSEQECRALIAQIRGRSASTPLDPHQNRRRVELLGRILADDARIRENLEPWLVELEQYLSVPRRRDPDR